MNLMFRNKWLLPAMVLWCMGPLWGEEICSKDTVCVRTENRDGAIDVYVKTLKTFEVTVTIKFPVFENLTASVPLPYTETFGGSSTVKVMTLVPVDKTKRWEYRYVFFWTYGSIYANHDDSYVYSLPYAPGTGYTVSQGFHGKFSHYGDNEYAIDWDIPIGTPVHAARDGVVVGVEDKNNQGGPDEKYRDFSNYVIIQHNDGTFGEYDHFRQYGITVQVGQKVSAGDLIGYSGNVGYSTGPHLHFFVYKAIDGERRESFPIRFRTSHGVETLAEGSSYRSDGSEITPIPDPVVVPIRTGDSNPATIVYQSIRFFEGGYDVPKLEERSYAQTFSQKTARYIYYEISVKNLLYKIRDNPVTVFARYYNPDGSIMGEPVLEYTINRDWEEAYLWHGWGWSEGGHWTSGTYRVEITIAGEVVTQEYFTITGDSGYGKTVEYQSTRFFESGATLVELGSRSYSDKFSKASTRYVYYEIYVKNLLYNVRDNPVTVNARYYKPDGTLFGEPVLNFTISRDWDYAYLWHGWGWPDAGNWTTGTYRVEISIAGERVAQQYFTIGDDGRSGKTVEYQSMRFFEGGYTPAELSTRSYSDKFSKSTTRYVYYEIYVKNLLYNVRDNPVTVTARYYKPDGTVFGEPVLNFTVSRDWDYSYLWHSWGWSEPGNWTPGTYRVEITLAGERVAQQYFTIVDDGRSGKTVEYQSMRFFESGYDTVELSQRIYSQRFPKATTRYVYYEIYVKNLLYNVRDNPVTVNARYYKPDGTVFGEPVLNFTISRDWEYSYLWHGWGWTNVGNWTPGTYRVEITIAGERIAEQYFTIY